MTRNLVLVYTLLVGLPVLAVVGTLEAGRTLAAPPAIAGTWTLDYTGAGAVCTGAPKVLSIKQSGAEVFLAFGGGGLEGVWSGDRYVSEADRVSLAGCGTNRVGLEIRTVAGFSKRWLTGKFTFPGCAACAPLEFRATKAGVKEPA